MKKEQWIEEVMNSMQGMQRAESNAYLHTRVMASLEKPSAKQVSVWKPTLALCSALMILLCLNIFIWNTNGNEETQPSALNAEKEYELITLNY